MPLGAGALAGVNYAARQGMGGSRARICAGSPSNAMDAVAARDAAFAYLAITASCALTLSRIAREIVLWTSAEFGLAALPDEWTSGSSIMPQKRNADGAELVRSKASGFLARLQGLGGVIKGLPLAYNSDLQEDKPYVFGSREELDLCLDSMVAMVEALTFDAAEDVSPLKVVTLRLRMSLTIWWARVFRFGMLIGSWVVGRHAGRRGASFGDRSACTSCTGSAPLRR